MRPAAVLLSVAVTVLALAAPARAQAPSPAAAASAPPAAPPAAPIVRVFEIRHADMSEVRLILPTLLSDGNVLTVDGASRTVTVVDRPEFVTRVESWLAQFDVPPDEVLVRIVLQRAERTAGASAEAPDAGWSYRSLAETTLQVLERGTATQHVGPDDIFEIHVRLGSVDAAQGLMHFDQVAIRRREDQPGGPVMREVFSTSVDAKHRVGKVVMATRDPDADEALVLRLLALVREP